MSNFVAALAFIFGIVLLIYTWKPILDWHLIVKPTKSTTFLSPLASFSENQNFSIEKPATAGHFEKQILPKSQPGFFLTIEKFGIQRAKVVTGENFLTNLAHLPGTARPGQVGNVFITGHSSLPQLFSPQSYWGIFSKLYLLENDDKITLDDGVESFNYLVKELLVVKPNDTWVIAPPTSFGSHLTLLTCGVGGLSDERIVIRAELSDAEKLI